jgi:hypothetical protein
MKINRIFLYLIVILSLVLGTLSISGASAQSVCSPATTISVPFSKDGAGTFCWQTSELCDHILSFNINNSLSINGTEYKNMFVLADSIPALNGGYTITYNSTIAFSHFEIAGPCDGNNLTSTPTVSRTPTLTSTSTLTPTRTRTATPGPSLTPTRTSTPLQGLFLKAQYLTGTSNASSMEIMPMIRVVNIGSVSVPLNDIGVSYWYSWDGTTQDQTWTCRISTAADGGGCENNITVGDIIPWPASPGADFLASTRFSINAGNIAPGEQITFQYSLTKSDSSFYTQTGDYSFNPSATTFTDAPKIGIYYLPSNSIIWGVPPPLSTATVTPTVGLPISTSTHTRTPTAVAPTNTPIRTRTPTIAPTSAPGTCSPVNASITVPFTFDGAGTLCWQASSLGSFINSWNTNSVTLNGVNVTNMWVGSGSYPAKIGGFYYVNYNGGQFGHFETKP